MLNEYHIKKEFGIIMQKYGVKDAVFDRGVMLLLAPYIFEAHISRTKIFFLVS